MPDTSTAVTRPGDAAMLNAYNAAAAPPMDAATLERIARRQRLLGPAYRLFYEKPLHFVRGDGVRLFDAAGRAYLDAYNNVASVGHCHPHVVEAMHRQAGTLNTHTRYLHDTVLDYAEKLLAKFPAELAHVMFTCTGSEANDLALRIARGATGGTGVIVTRLAYHGVTSAVAEFSPSLGAHVSLGQNVRTVAAPDAFRADPATVAQAFADEVQAAIDDLRRRGVRPAALLVDTIFSSDGIFCDPAGFLQPAVQAIREAGGVFIADEVQPGFCRTGENWWGFQRHGLVPDLVTLGKPMGNGYPVAGVVARPQLLEAFGARSRYFNTFGGNPVAAAAGLAVLEVIENEGLKDNAARVGAYLRDAINGLRVRHPMIADVRGNGLFIGVELASEPGNCTPATKETHRVVNYMREAGVLLSSTGPGGNVLKLRPPLSFSTADADELVSALDGVLAAL